MSPERMADDEWACFACGARVYSYIEPPPAPKKQGQRYPMSGKIRM